MKIKFVIALLCALMILCSCNQNLSDTVNTGESTGETAGSSKITLILPEMTLSEINDLQEVFVYNEDTQILHYKADTLQNKLRIATSRSKSLINAELDIDLAAGNYAISAKGIGYKGNGFEMEKTPITVQEGGTPIKYVCQPQKTSYIYLECEAFIPFWIRDFVTLDIIYSTGTHISGTKLNINNGKYALRNIPGETIIKAELSEKAKMLGYSLSFETSITIKENEASTYKITVSNELFKKPENGTKLVFNYDKNGMYSFFNSFTSWFPKNGINTENDEDRKNNSYGFIVCYVPESYTQTLYIPNNLNLDLQSSDINYCTEAAERHIITKNQSSEWNITTSYAKGKTAWFNVTIGPLPQEMIDTLDHISINYGDSTLGGWGGKYIASNFGEGKVITQKMAVTPGDFEFTAILRAKEGKTLNYDLVPDKKSLKTEAGYEYSISFMALDKLTGEIIQ